MLCLFHHLLDCVCAVDRHDTTRPTSPLTAHRPSPKHERARVSTQLHSEATARTKSHYVMATAPAPSILPLPEHVVAQIKSSTAIVSLTDVLLELLRNSLDAKAIKIDATVDFARGGCTVEDDGLGIAPLEFREDGGLGKLYCMFTGLMTNRTARYSSGQARPNIMHANLCSARMAPSSPRLRLWPS